MGIWCRKLHNHRLRIHFVTCIVLFWREGLFILLHSWFLTYAKTNALDNFSCHKLYFPTIIFSPPLGNSSKRTKFVPNLDVTLTQICQGLHISPVTIIPCIMSCHTCLSSTAESHLYSFLLSFIWLIQYILADDPFPLFKFAIQNCCSNRPLSLCLLIYNNFQLITAPQF